jgi:hypothetical protein
MKEKESLHCILCGTEIPEGQDKCPLCGTQARKVGSEAPQQSDAHKEPSEEYLTRDIPSANLPEIKRLCPVCAMSVDDNIGRCPRCGIPLRQESEKREEMLSCPECGALSPISAKSCVKCGVGFAEVGIPASKPTTDAKTPGETRAPRTQEGLAHPAESTSRISVPSTVPGKGLTNGRSGAVNGTLGARSLGGMNRAGIVNGTGVTNGTGVSELREVQSRRTRTAGMRWQFFAILAAIAIVIPIFIFVAYPHSSGITIDGKFGDWKGAEMFSMQAQAAAPEITVSDWSVESRSSSVFVYIDTEASLMSSSNVDTFYVFVDLDDDPGTGYSVSGIGADYLLEMDGWDGQIRTSSIMQFEASADQTDWNGWTDIGSMSVSVASDKLEARADLPSPLGPNARYLLLSQSNSPDQDYSVSYPVPEKGGLLIAKLEPGPSIDVATGTVAPGASSSFARLVLTCDGVGGDITDVTPMVLGGSLASTFDEISMVRGETVSLDILVDTSLTATADLVSIMIQESDFISSFSDVTILKGSVSAYSGSAPASIKIDGAFGDWTGRFEPDSDSAPVVNSNINITATGFADMSDFAAFYVSVEGKMFQGVYAPSAKSKPSGGGGGGGNVIINKKSGEDVLRIFIDSDLLSSTGLVVVQGNKTIGADYLIDVRGINGNVVSKSVQECRYSNWVPISSNIAVGKDAQHLEVGVPIYTIGGVTSLSAIIETTDWRDRSDWAWTGSAPDPWAIDALGNTYMTSDGHTWSYLGTPTLEPGDHIVDISMTQDQSDVLLVTNTGRTYYWTLGTSTVWTAGETIPIDTATYSDAVSMAFYSSNGASAWLLTQNGSYFWLQNAHKSNKAWTYQNTPLIGYSDYTDLFYAGGTMYALRSAQNSSLNFSSNGNSFTSVTNPTGSTSNQTQLVFFPNTSGTSDDVLYVLCENGNIRYSNDGGTTWSALGDLPVPSGANTTKYVDFGIDSAGYMWVMTDTGLTYRSTGTATYNNFTCAGQSPIGDIVAILPTTVVVPEFSYMVLPIMIILFIVLSRRAMTRRRDTQ